MSELQLIPAGQGVAVRVGEGQTVKVANGWGKKFPDGTRTTRSGGSTGAQSE